MLLQRAEVRPLHRDWISPQLYPQYGSPEEANSRIVDVDVAEKQQIWQSIICRCTLQVLLFNPIIMSIVLDLLNFNSFSKR